MSQRKDRNWSRKKRLKKFKMTQNIISIRKKSSLLRIKLVSGKIILRMRKEEWVLVREKCVRLIVKLFI